MGRRGLVLVPLVTVLAIVGLWLVLSRASLSALSEPSQVETYAATKAKRWLVARSLGREVLPPQPANDAASVAIGNMQFGARCAACHGVGGRTPTDVGQWMYPRTPDLSSSAVQEWSDAELFWIIKHGIRLTGMPGFGKIHSDEQIWHLVHYVRSLGAQPKS